MTDSRDIIEFAGGLGFKPAGQHADLFVDCGITGDDGDEFLAEFAKTYGVDMSGFLWYFHYNANEPPFAETSWPYSRDGRKLERISLTATLLAEAASEGAWPLAYPEHVVRGGWKGWIPIVAAAVLALAALGVFLLLS